jgi:hypothetical protein
MSIGLILAGMIGAMAGAQMASSTRDNSAFTWLFISSILLGVILGPLAARLTLTRLQHFVLWGSLIFFNLGSVAIEGAYFVPELVTGSLACLVHPTITGFGGRGAGHRVAVRGGGQPASSWADALRTRPWHSWVWRFVVSAFSYLCSISFSAR